MSTRPVWQISWQSLSVIHRSIVQNVMQANLTGRLLLLPATSACLAANDSPVQLSLTPLTPIYIGPTSICPMAAWSKEFSANIVTFLYQFRRTESESNFVHWSMFRTWQRSRFILILYEMIQLIETMKVYTLMFIMFIISNWILIL